jgi:hypothetical protein
VREYSCIPETRLAGCPIPFVIDAPKFASASPLSTLWLRGCIRHETGLALSNLLCKAKRPASTSTLADRSRFTFYTRRYTMLPFSW